MIEREKLTVIVENVQKGKEGAASELYETFRDDIYYYILKTVNDEELAADLTQDTFVEIFQTIQNLREPAAFVTWSRQIAYHRCTAHFRKRKELLADETEDGGTVFDALEEEREEFIPDESLDQEEFKKTIHSMIDSLPEEQRSAIMMRYFDELSVKEIAKVQETTEGTVKSRLNYGRKAIKKAVEEYEKKTNTKLHCVGVVPLLIWLFKESKEANAMAGVAQASASGVAKLLVEEGVKTGVNVATKHIVGKVAACIVATALIGGGVAGIVHMHRAEKDNKTTYEQSTNENDSVETQEEVLGETEDGRPIVNLNAYLSIDVSDNRLSVKPDIKKFCNQYRNRMDCKCDENGIYFVELLESGQKRRADFGHTDKKTAIEDIAEDFFYHYMISFYYAELPNGEQIEFGFGDEQVYIEEGTIVKIRWNTDENTLADMVTMEELFKIKLAYEDITYVYESKEVSYEVDRDEKAEKENQDENKDENEDSHVHKYIQVEVVSATCEGVGHETYSCECGSTYTTDIQASGHVYNDVVTEPTCVEEGYTTHTCSGCGDSYVDNQVNQKGHNYSKLNTSVAATKTENGYRIYSCECGANYEIRMLSDRNVVLTTFNQGFEEERVAIIDDPYIHLIYDIDVKEEIFNGDVLCMPYVSYCPGDLGEHKHEEEVRGKYTYVYCDWILEPYSEEYMIYYPYEYYG